MNINKKKTSSLIQTVINTAGNQYLGTSSIPNKLTNSKRGL